jgi:murein DD-endopeptidase MepM/ murein hydrolase activator NlpD
MTHSGLGKSGLDGGLGYFAEVTDSDGVKARYGHMNDMPNIIKGEPVKAGQELGEVGSTGYSSGNHLHFDMKDKNGNYIPPTEKQIQDLLDMLNRNCK